MPNHVFNIVTVDGPPQIVELLDHAVKSDEIPFDFQRIIPMPANADEVTSESFSWQIDHWGTKWNAYGFAECKPGRYSFHTAWDPPLPVLEVLSNLFPELTISIEFLDECEDESQSLTFGADNVEVA